MDEQRIVGHSGLIRQLNEKAVLDVIKEHSPITRPEIRLSTLSYPTVNKSIQTLLDNGLVRCSGQGKTRERLSLACSWSSILTLILWGLRFGEQTASGCMLTFL